MTGASTGIGLDAARKLAGDGFRVFGTVRRPEDGKRLEQAGVTPLLVDVTDQESIAAASARVAEKLNSAPLVGLVNNAGIALPGPVELLELSAFRSVFEVNLFGVVAVTKAFLPLLKESRGRIINISSMWVVHLAPFNAPYASSKCALEALSDCLRRELYPYGIDVIVIRPGNVKTPIWEKGASQDTSRICDTIYEIPLGKMQAEAESVRAMPPSYTSQAIHHALVAERPAARIEVVRRRNRLRYRMLSWLPQRWKDRTMIRRVWGHLPVTTTSDATPD